MISATIGSDHYKTELVASGHRLMADEHEDKGGTNLGPAPTELLLLSLASCTAITLRMYADRKGWPVERITVETDILKDGNKSVINRGIKVEGELSEEQRSRLLQIANSCPVHKTLTNPIEITTHMP